MSTRSWAQGQEEDVDKQEQFLALCRDHRNFRMHQEKTAIFFIPKKV